MVLASGRWKLREKVSSSTIAFGGFLVPPTSNPATSHGICFHLWLALVIDSRQRPAFLQLRSLRTACLDGQLGLTCTLWESSEHLKTRITAVSSLGRHRWFFQPLLLSPEGLILTPRSPMGAQGWWAAQAAKGSLGTVTAQSRGI